jgi:hypothetical protein
MLNAQALGTGDLANLFMRDVPITLSRHVTTEDTDGNKAIVREVAAMMGPGGQAMQSTDTWYAIDRKSMNAISRADAAGMANADKITEDRQGLVIGFPIGTEAKDYDGWSSDYQTTVKTTYVRKEERGGLDTYVFQSSSTPKETLDPEMLAIFPPALGKAVLAGLAQTLDLPAAMKEQFAAVLPNLPDMVPLKYTYEYETNYWVEPQTGVLVDYDKHEAYKVALQLPGLPAPVPVTSVFEQTYHSAAASVEDAAQDAKDAKGQLNLFGTTVPLALGAAGIVLFLVGLLLARR